MGKKQVRFTLGFESRMNIVKSDALNAVIRERGVYRISALGTDATDAVENLAKRIKDSAYDAEYIRKMGKVCEKWLAEQRGAINVGEVSMLRDGDARCCICHNRLFESEGAFFSDGKYSCFSCDPRMNEVSYAEHLRTGKVFKGICGVALHDAANIQIDACGQCQKNLVLHLGAVHTARNFTEKRFCSDECLREFVKASPHAEAIPADKAEFMELLNADEAIAPGHQFAKCVFCRSLGQATDKLMRRNKGIVFCSVECRQNLLDDEPEPQGDPMDTVREMRERAKDQRAAEQPYHENAEWFMVNVGGNDVHRAEVKTPNGTVIVTIGLCGRLDGEYDGKRCAAYSLFHKGYKHEWEAPICIAEARYAVEWAAHVANGCQSDSVYKGEIKE